MKVCSRPLSGIGLGHWRFNGPSSFFRVPSAKIYRVGSMETVIKPKSKFGINLKELWDYRELLTGI